MQASWKVGSPHEGSLPATAGGEWRLRVWMAPRFDGYC